MRLLDSDAYYGTPVRLAALLLDGDSAAAEEVTRDSLAALQQAWSRLRDPEKARVYLHQSVVNGARSVRRYWPSATATRHKLRRIRRAPGVRPSVTWAGIRGSARCVVLAGLYGHGRPEPFDDAAVHG
jgi:hypothetical protein